MAERLTKSAARNVFYGGSAFFFAIFLGLTAHSHYYMADTSTDEAKLTDSVARGKHVWEKNSCINCHTLLGEGAYFAPELGNVWDRYGGHEDPRARGCTEAWMQAQPSGIAGTAADAAVQPDRPGTRRPRRLPGVDQPHQDPELAAEQGRLTSYACGKTTRRRRANA